MHVESVEIPFDAIVEQSVAGIYVIQDERFAYANATWAGIVGYAPEEMVGEHLSRFVPPHFLGEVLSRVRQRLDSDPPSMHFITRGLHRKGHEVLIEVHGSRMVYAGRPAVIGVGVDVTERLRNEAELHHSREQLRALTAYTADKLEEQRLSIARDVHDQLGGMLTSIKMDASRILRRAEGAELQAITQGLLAITQQTIEAVKQISEALRPPLLDHLELSLALQHELRNFTRRSGILHTLHARAPGLRLSPKRSIAVYRVFQEALTNVARHAHAHRVAVELDAEGEQLCLKLQDDGRGFDTAQPGGTALGLLSMRERAREIGGSLDIASTPGSGTGLVLRIPLL